MLNATQPAVKFAGFSREREIRIREIRRVGREERHQERDESARYVGGSNPPPSTNAEGRIEIIPVSRQHH